MGQSGDKQWLSNAFNWQLILTPINTICFLLLCWKAITAGMLHALGCDLHAQVVMVSAVTAPAFNSFTAGCGAPFRVVATYMGLTMTMLLQAFCCVWAALVLRAAHWRAERDCGAGAEAPLPEKLPRGWRGYPQPNGAVMYKHKKTGRMQWERPPGWEHLTISEAEEGMSDSSAFSASEEGYYKTSRAYLTS
mmetsp:Transcript_15952/g.26530  ORF Transcript_15952/g.26530 Transcript_15952/m.26530 type:complete len:192 (-) Transcript_15952:276-851(-)